MTIDFNKSQAKNFNRYYSMLKREWFFSPNGIHGLEHIKRVLIYVLLLSKDLDLNNEDTDLLCLCAIYHDIGRSNDLIDDCHGYESYKKLIELNLFLPDNDEDKKIIKFIITNHSIDDKTAIENISSYNISDTSRAVELFKIFKDCDALDRVRVNHLDDNYLRYELSKKYIPFAWDIFKNPKSMAVFIN